MSVVLRCPSCGTTRFGNGQCEACHEAQVRYFCTNHVPGLWLDTDVCPRCHMGTASSAPPRPTSVPRAVRRERERPPTPTPRAAPATPRPVIAPRGARAEATPAIDVRAGAHGPIHPEEREITVSGFTPRSVLAAILDARAEHSRVTRTGSTAGGCLRRLLMVVLLLAMGLGLALFLFGRALLHTLQP